MRPHMITQGYHSGHDYNELIVLIIIFIKMIMIMMRVTYQRDPT